MENNTQTGVYANENSQLSSSITQVETAIPAFIGYTQIALDESGGSLLNKPTRITSILEYERVFGKPFIETGLKVTVAGNPNNPTSVLASLEKNTRSKYRMHYAMQLFFANGGGVCWIVSAGTYSEIGLGTINFVDIINALNTTETVDEITLYVYPDAQGLDLFADFYNLFNASIIMCERLRDRFTVMDIWQDPITPGDVMTNIQTMRDHTLSSESSLQFGATYVPNLETILNFYYGEEGVGDNNVTIDGSFKGTLTELRQSNPGLYLTAQNAIRNLSVEMPPSPAIAGVFSRVDNLRGVWKPPANVTINYVVKPVLNITDLQQNSLNVDLKAGKSVNAIRSFSGRGNAMVWGARTMAGNNNEWRYISVRRFFNMVEESIKKGTIPFVIEQNNINTWSRVKLMIDHFLLQLWRAGALGGVTPEKAFYVKVGLNETMNAVDINAGRMIIEIGLAVIKPMEFSIIKISHFMRPE